MNRDIFRTNLVNLSCSPLEMENGGINKFNKLLGVYIGALCTFVVRYVMSMDLKRHLFVSDMDGTLLNEDSLISHRTAEIISRLSHEGALITVATARTPATVEELMKDTYIDIPAIVLTGAAMWDREQKRYVNPVLHDPEALPALMKTFHTHNVNPFIYVLGDDETLKVFHNGEMNRHERKFYEERRYLGLKRFILDSPEGEQPYIPGTILVFAVGKYDDIEKVANTLKEDSRLAVSFYRDIFNHDIAYLEVFRAGVSKSAAIKRLAEIVGATSITVYGDNLNDLSMMEIADDSAAVANAVEEVRQRASRQIGSNREDSVALDMERIFFGRK